MTLANYTADRRATALRCLNDPDFKQAQLTYRARLLYAVGLLICNEIGVMTKDDIKVAMADPSIVQAARALLREAR